MASAGDEFEEDKGLEDAEVVTKYKLAGEIANRVLKQVVDASINGASVLTLCKLGDAEILKAVAGLYNKKVEGRAIEKGIAFPTCLSLNNCICHNSPLESEPEVLLKTGDVVKIDLGVHIDGYIAPVATTLVVGASKESPVDGVKADVIGAAYYAAEVALRMIKPGGKTSDVTKAMLEVTKDFGCVPVEGMLSHQLLRNVIDGEKAIISNPTEQNKKDHKESEFAVNEVYALDIFASTAEGKAKHGEQRTTVFKRTDNKYMLKLAASRALVSEVSKKFTVMPFTLRMCEDEKKAKFAVSECVSHQVLQPFDILWEAENAFVAQFKILVLIMPNGTLRVTSGLFDPEVYKTTKAVSNDVYKKMLATTVGSKSKKKKKTASKKKDGEADDKEDDKEEAAGDA